MPDRTDYSRVNFVTVASSNVAAIGYDKADSRLWLRTLKGLVYSYEMVPESVYRSFLVAPSKGTFLWVEIRNYGRDDRYELGGPY